MFYFKNLIRIVIRRFTSTVYGILSTSQISQANQLEFLTKYDKSTSKSYIF